MRPKSRVKLVMESLHAALVKSSQYPWFWMNGEITGERVGDVHLRIADKRAARAERGAATDD